MERTIAAVDLGSNSFHMVVARVGDAEELQVLDRIRVRVRLAGGLDPDTRELAPEARSVALDCLRRFGERIGDLPHAQVRAVGTDTFRQVRDASFLTDAEGALGHPIAIVSGREEARLVFLGVTHDLDGAARRLVVDIGGGSTEIIVGDGTVPDVVESKHMGCVSWTRRFFPDGVLSAARMEEAVTAALLELEPDRQRFRRSGPEEVWGSSGTILAAEGAVVEGGFDPSGLTLGGLERLLAWVLRQAHARQLAALPGVPVDRAEVLPGGLAILLAVFKALGLERMTASSSALREGILYDLMGRMARPDAREHVVVRLARRYGVDAAQGARVQASALAFFDQVSHAWDLGPNHRALLAMAARLHELGMFVGHSGYHKHGAYVLEHADLPGFSRQEQGTVAALVLGHRRKLRPDELRRLAPHDVTGTLRLVALLRVAHCVHRSRSARAAAVVRARVEEGVLRLVPVADALADRPLTRTDLEENAEVLTAAGVSVRVG